MRGPLREILWGMIAMLSWIAVTNAAPQRPALPPFRLTLNDSVRSDCLPNGLLATVRKQPGGAVVHLGLVLDVGRSDDPADLPGLAKAAAHVWADARPAGVRRGAELADLGEWQFTVGTDVTTITIATPRVLLDQALAGLASAFNDPMPAGSSARLPETLADLEARWRIAADWGGDRGVEYLFPALFGPMHPYALVDEPSPPDYMRIHPAALASFYAEQWRPQNASLHVFGDVGLDEVAAVVNAATPATGGARDCPSFAPTDEPPPSVLPRVAPVVRNARADQRRLDLAWTLPAGLGRQDFLPELLADVVSAHSRGVTCQSEELREATVLWCSVELEPTDVPKEVADRVLQHIARLGTPVVLPADSLRVHLRRWMDGPLRGGGDEYVLRHQHRNDGADAWADARVTMDRARAESVGEFLGAWLTRHRAVVGVVEAGPMPPFAVGGPVSPVVTAAPVSMGAARLLPTTTEPIRTAQRTLPNGARLVAVQVPGAQTVTVQVLARGAHTAGSRPKQATAVDWTDWWRILNDGSAIEDQLTESLVSRTSSRGELGWSDGWTGPVQRFDPMVWMAWKRMEGVYRLGLAPTVLARRYGAALRKRRDDPHEAVVPVAVEALVEENPWIASSVASFRSALPLSSKDWRAVSEGLRQPDNTTILVVAGLEPEAALDRVAGMFASWPVRKATLPPRAWAALPDVSPGMHATILDRGVAGTALLGLACRMGQGAPDTLIEAFEGGAAGDWLAEAAGLPDSPTVSVLASPLHQGILFLGDTAVASDGGAAAQGISRWLDLLVSIADDEVVRAAAGRAIVQGMLARSSVERASSLFRDVLLQPGGLAVLEAEEASLRSTTAGDVRASLAPCGVRRELAIAGGDEGVEPALVQLGFDVTRRSFSEWLDAHAPAAED